MLFMLPWVILILHRKKSRKPIRFPAFNKCKLSLFLCVFLLELFDPSLGVMYLLFAGKERVTF